MTRLEGLIKGLQLFNERLDHSKYQAVAAEHDIIFGPHKDAVELTAEEIASLDEMGWHIDSDGGWAFHV